MGSRVAIACELTKAAVETESGALLWARVLAAPRGRKDGLRTRVQIALFHRNFAKKVLGK